jgi:hypothetical protein
MTSVEVLCGKLDEDADKWRQGADMTAAAAQVIAGLNLGKEQFGLIAEDRGLVATYTALWQKFTNLFNGATTEFDKIAATLSEVAQTYLMEDQAGAHDFRRIQDAD